MEKFFVSQKNNRSVVIGGVRSLSEFTSEQIVVGVPGACVVVVGFKLQIARFDENEISIVGQIASVETQPKGARSV